MVNPKKGAARLSHCVKGHAFDKDNTRLWKGHRICKTCHREQMQRARAVLKEGE